MIYDGEKGNTFWLVGDKLLYRHIYIISIMQNRQGTHADENVKLINSSRALMKKSI